MAPALPEGWHLYIAGVPKCNPQSAQGPSRLHPASISTSPSVQCNIASGIRSLSCAGQRTA
eukprot:10668816-Alexandrium_andersonii.AAC.1